jgi:hypothetical protein
VFDFLGKVEGAIVFLTALCNPILDFILVERLSNKANF